ncbi:MAG: hypothetical protein ABRQ26_01600 [Syntrophomonadaceae bacterium]
MRCPLCQTFLNEQNACPQCGWTTAQSKWALLGGFELPRQLIIESLLQSYGIPMKTIHQDPSQFTFKIGPLAETLIFVPDFYLSEALELIEGQNEFPYQNEEPE